MPEEDGEKKDKHIYTTAISQSVSFPVIIERHLCLSSPNDLCHYHQGKYHSLEKIFFTQGLQNISLPFELY